MRELAPYGKVHSGSIHIKSFKVLKKVKKGIQEGELSGLIRTKKGAPRREYRLAGDGRRGGRKEKNNILEANPWKHNRVIKVETLLIREHRTSVARDHKDKKKRRNYCCLVTCFTVGPHSQALRPDYWAENSELGEGR